MIIVQLLFFCKKNSRKKQHPNKEIIFFFAFVFSFCEFIVFGWFAEWTWFLTWSVTLFQSFRHLFLAHASLFITECNKLPANNRLMHLRRYKLLSAPLFPYFWEIFTLSNFYKIHQMGLVMVCCLFYGLIFFVLNSRSIDNESLLNIQMQSIFFYILFEMFFPKKKLNSLTSCGHDQ